MVEFLYIDLEVITKMKPKTRDETISTVDAMIRVLSKSTPHGTFLNEDDIKSLGGIELDDQPKLADRLEELIVFLKDEPDNKRKILELHDTLMDEFGHITPVFETLSAIKTLYLIEK